MLAINNSAFGSELTAIQAVTVSTTFAASAWPDLVTVGSATALATTMTIPAASGLNAWKNPALGQFRVLNNSSYPVTVAPASGSIVGSSVVGPGAGATFYAIAGSWTNADSAANVGSAPQTVNSQSAAYAILASDMGKLILHPTADNNARTFTIPANSSVPISVGASFEIYNQINTVTLAITTDTLTLYPGASTGSRTIAVANYAKVTKLSSTSWAVWGTSGVT